MKSIYLPKNALKIGIALILFYARFANAQLYIVGDATASFNYHNLATNTWVAKESPTSIGTSLLSDVTNIYGIK